MWICLNIHLRLCLSSLFPLFVQIQCQDHPQMIFYYTLLGSFREYTPRQNQGASVRATEASASNYFCPAGTSHKEAFFAKFQSLFPEAFFFPFPRYLLRAKLLIELQLCDTRYYKNLSLLWFFHFLTFYTLIITCFAVFQFRLKQYSLRLFFLSFISMVIIGKRGFQEPL